MSFEDRLPEEYETLAAREGELVRQLLQFITVEYREAARLEKDTGKIYIKGFSNKVGEESWAFRKISKKPYIGDGLAGGQTITHESMIVHVPKGSDPDVWLTRCWVDHQNRYGMEASFQVDYEAGLRPYESKDDVIMDETVQSVMDPMEQTEIEVDIDTMLKNAAKMKQDAVKATETLLQLLRSEYETVPFDSL